MLSYNEMIKCEKEFTCNENQMLITKYKEFVEYIKKVVSIIFKDNEEQIVSYIKETKNQFFLLEWCVGGLHHIGFFIDIDVLNNKILDVTSLKAHDVNYDSLLRLSSIDDEALLTFFNNEYRQFMKLFVPCYHLTDLHNANKLIDESDSIVCQIVMKFNEVCYHHFKGHFTSLGINDEKSFMKSKFSLSFTNERRTELDKEVYEYYNSYHEKVNELTKKFDESVKDLK